MAHKVLRVFSKTIITNNNKVNKQYEKLKEPCSQSEQTVYADVNREQV